MLAEYIVGCAKEYRALRNSGHLAARVHIRKIQIVFASAQRQGASHEISQR